jgi:biopolymer transport protein ExbD
MRQRPSSAPLSLRLSDDGEAEVQARINTTPLVDVMLVLLIIFLITIPVATQSVPLPLPLERNTARDAQPDTVELAVAADGQMHWNAQRLAGRQDLAQRLTELLRRHPDAEVHIRGDRTARYALIGAAAWECRQAGVKRLHFVTDPAGAR